MEGCSGIDLGTWTLQRLAGCRCWPDFEWRWREASLNPRGNAFDLFSRRDVSMYPKKVTVPLLCLQIAQSWLYMHRAIITKQQKGSQASLAFNIALQNGARVIKTGSVEARSPKRNIGPADCNGRVEEEGTNQRRYGLKASHVPQMWIDDSEPRALQNRANYNEMAPQG